MKEIKRAISVVIEDSEGRVLFALRSPHKNPYPLTWSLPSHYVQPNEVPAETVARIGKNKLGVKLELVALLKEDTSDAGEYIYGICTTTVQKS